MTNNNSRRDTTFSPEVMRTLFNMASKANEYNPPERQTGQHDFNYDRKYMTYKLNFQNMQKSFAEVMFHISQPNVELRSAGQDPDLHLVSYVNGKRYDIVALPSNYNTFTWTITEHTIA